ncbi:Pentatricopeptide repeat-containing protein [Durusdinium trenchii]|uniref:Chloroplastic n=1 Tax=Durusdinium trenchii TaxID=1381693 RepID=A0ABP0QWP4_9DINO
MPTNRNYGDAAQAAMNFATKSGSQSIAPLLPTRELRDRIEKGENVVLVDVRGSEEQAVSMIPGAVTKEYFESDLLPKLLASDPSDKAPLVVPYCTVGFRSGVYAKELIERKGLRNVRNGEGVIMWTFDGNGLVQPGGPGSTVAQALGRSAEAELAQTAWPSVTRVHVFGKPWDMAAEGYTTEYFSNTGGAWRFVKQKCYKAGPTFLPWFTVFLLFYLFFTPACGVMYSCGCRLALSKFGQVETCNIYWPDQPPEHKCPWCTCQGIACIFVASDAKAFRGVLLLDMLPDGFIVTLVTVLVLYFTFKAVDRFLRRRNCGDCAIAAVKTAEFYFDPCLLRPMEVIDPDALRATVARERDLQQLAQWGVESSPRSARSVKWKLPPRLRFAADMRTAAGSLTSPRCRSSPVPSRRSKRHQREFALRV